MKSKLLAVLGFIALYNLIFYKAGFGLSPVLFFLSLNALLYLLRNKEAKTTSLGIFFSTLSSVFALLLLMTTNPILTVLNFSAAILNATAAFFFYNFGSRFSYNLVSYLEIPFKSSASFIEGVFASPQLAKNTSVTKVDTVKTSAILKGFFLAVPLALIFLFLFSIADPVYGKYTDDFLQNIKNFFVGPFWERLIHNLILIIALLGILTALLKLRTEEKDDQSNSIESTKQLELITFLAIPVLIFLSFIIVQFEYLFTTLSERRLAEIGIESLTFSEYVRRGFVELLIVSAISLGLIGFASRYVHRLKNRHELVLKGLISLLIIETKILLFSVFWRIVMYQMEHGLTRNRIFGMFVLIALALTLFLYLAKILANIKQKYLFLGIALIATLTLSLATLANIDRMIAVDYKPTVNERVDVAYISRLSTDAAEGWVEAISIAETEINRITQRPEYNSENYYHLTCASRAVGRLNIERNHLLNKYQDDGLKNWKELNLSEYNAFQIIKNNQSEFNKLPTLNEQAGKLLAEFRKNGHGGYVPTCGSY